MAQKYPIIYFDTTGRNGIPDSPNETLRSLEEEVTNTEQDEHITNYSSYQELTNFNLDRSYETNNMLYEINPTCPLMIIIFIMEKFKSHSTREEASQQYIEIIDAFKRQNIFIDKLYLDKESENVKCIIQEICDDIDAKRINPSSIILFFLSHGEEGDNLLCSDSKLISVSDLYKPFAECSGLEGKPKAFFIQACKSKNIPTEEENYNYYFVNANDTIPPKKLVADTCWQLDYPKDIIIAYSTLENEVSVRDWFTPEFCKNVIQYGGTDCLHHILLKTIKGVTEIRLKNFQFKQMPIFISTLTKKWFLKIPKDMILLNNINAEIGK